MEVTSLPSDRISVEASRIIHAPVDRLWAKVANFNNLPAWHPDVTESRLEGVGATGDKPGDIRALRLRNGTIVRERLIAMDSAAHRYEYSVLDGQLPLKNHLSSMSMRPLDAHTTEVTWKASFEAAGAPADTLAQGVRSNVLELGLQGLEEKVKDAA
jgi:uncharacterized membrane protein